MKGIHDLSLSNRARQTGNQQIRKIQRNSDTYLSEKHAIKRPSAMSGPRLARAKHDQTSSLHGPCQKSLQHYLGTGNDAHPLSVWGSSKRRILLRSRLILNRHVTSNEKLAETIRTTTANKPSSYNKRNKYQTTKHALTMQH
jgi:hypothetical protein